MSRVGRYKILSLFGLAVMTGGMGLLALLGQDASEGEVIRDMIILGAGLGLSLPLYTMIVQNAVGRKQMGVATGAIQFFRSIGGTVGTAVFGTIMLTRYHASFVAHAPAGMSASQLAEFSNPLRLVQTPGALAGYPASILADLKTSLVMSLDTVFLIGAGLAGVAFLLNFWLEEVPLRKSSGTGRPALEPA